MKITAVALASTLAAVSLSTTASAQEVFHRREQGPLAFALIERIEGCITTTVELLALDQVLRESPGSEQPDQAIVIDIEQENTCGQEPVTLLSARGQSDLSNADFQVAKKLESASLVATVEVADGVSGNSFDVFIDVAWLVTTPLERVHEKFFSRDPDGFFHAQDRGTFRDADVIGTISDGTTNFLQSATVLIAALNDVTSSLIEASKKEK